MKDQWLITGVWKTTSPLHIGDGRTGRDRPGLKRPDGSAAEYSRVARGVEGFPLLPGAALKGVLRSRLGKLAIGAEESGIASRLLGTRDPDAPDAVAGVATFFDSLAVEPNAHWLGQQAANRGAGWSHWCEAARTGIAVGIGLDRRTRSVADSVLFNCEVVPAGISFPVRIWVRDADETEIGFLLALVNELNRQDWPAAIGAETHNGWGRGSWQPGAVHRVSAPGLAHWVKNPVPITQFAQANVTEMLKLPEPHLLNLRKESNPLHLRLVLRFSGPFLVNRLNDANRAEEDAMPEDQRAHARPRLDPDGRVVLDPESFRGAIRSRAERIIRTVAPAGRRQLLAPDPTGTSAAAFRGFEPERSGRSALTEPERLQLTDERRTGALGLIPLLFGAGGWGSPIVVMDAFKSKKPTREYQPGANAADKSVHFRFRLERTAIDRFTGSVAQKFACEYVWQPELEGRILIDVERWRATGDKSYRLGIALLAFILRDLMEGDIAFGYGTTHDFGKAILDPKANPDVVQWLDSPEVSEALRHFDGEFHQQTNR